MVWKPYILSRYPLHLSYSSLSLKGFRCSMCSNILLRNYIRLCRHENEKSASYKIDKNTIGKKNPNTIHWTKFVLAKKKKNSLWHCHEWSGILWAPNLVQMWRGAVYSGRNLRTFRRSLMPPTSRQKNITKTKAEHFSETSVISQ
jgi:hypothetical protein